MGASVCALAPRGVSKLALGLTAAALACMPDLDVVGFQYGIAYSSPWGHRGLSHSLSVALAVSFAASLAVHRPRRGGGHKWAAALVLLILATASHGVLDAFTDAGLGVGFFLPFDDTRYFFTHRPLATSPIGVASFFNRSSLSILANEFLWVWMPCLIALALLALMKSLAGRSARFRAGE